MTLLELDGLLAPSSPFAARVRCAAIVAASGVELTTDDYASAPPGERAARSILAGADLSGVVRQGAVMAYNAGLPLSGAGDVQISDGDLRAAIEPLLVKAFAGGVA